MSEYWLLMGAMAFGVIGLVIVVTGLIMAATGRGVMKIDEPWWMAGVRNLPNDLFWMAVGAALMYFWIRP